FEVLRDEARDNLLDVLIDPIAADSEPDRQKKVERSYELSYRHLSVNAKRLFARLSRLPAGVWQGRSLRPFLRWEELLGHDWQSTMERELNYFALVHFEPERNDEGSFEMLAPMRAFAAKKHREQDDREWEKQWTEFWRSRVSE